MRADSRFPQPAVKRGSHRTYLNLCAFCGSVASLYFASYLYKCQIAVSLRDNAHLSKKSLSAADIFFLLGDLSSLCCGGGDFGSSLAGGACGGSSILGTIGGSILCLIGSMCSCLVCAGGGVWTSGGVLSSLIPS